MKCLYLLLLCSVGIYSYAMEEGSTMLVPGGSVGKPVGPKDPGTFEDKYKRGGKMDDIRTSIDFTDEAFAMLSGIAHIGRTMTPEEAGAFADLIVRALPLESPEGTAEATLYVQEIPEGKEALQAAQKSGDYSGIKPLIIEYETKLS